jgi:hypothetical protein
MAAAAIAFCRWFGRRNYLAYVLLIWLMALRVPMTELFGTGNGALEMQGWLLGAVVAASLIWAVAPAIARRKNAGTDAGVAA